MHCQNMSHDRNEVHSNFFFHHLEGKTLRFLDYISQILGLLVDFESGIVICIFGHFHIRSIAAANTNTKVIIIPSITVNAL